MKIISDNYKKIIIFFFLLIIFYNFIDTKHYPINDEFHSMITYSSLETFFFRDTTNNHFINNLSSILLNKFYYLDIKFLRFISILLVAISFLVLFSIFQTKEAVILSFIIFLISDNLYIFSFLFRGWPYFIILLSLIFYLMNEIENNYKKLENNFKIILILSSIIILSAPSNIYIILPILLYLISLYFNRSKTIPLKSICIYFFLPCLILFILQIVTNGIYVLRDDFLIDMELFSSPDKNLKIAKIFFENYLSILTNGVHVFLNNYNQTSKGIINLIQDIYFQDKVLLLIYVILTSNIIIKLFKKVKLKSIDIIFILHLILIIFLSKYNTIRIFVPFYVLYFVGLDQFLNENKIIKNYSAKISFVFLIISLLLIVFLKPFNLDERIENSVYYSNLNSDFIVHKKYLNEISKKHDLACKKKLLNENEVKKRMLYYYFLSKCKNKLILYDKYLFFK